MTLFTNIHQLNQTFFRYLFICIFAFIISCKKEALNNATISGIVTESGVSVSQCNLSLSSRSFNQTSKSDTNGNYIFKNLPLGDYQIIASFYSGANYFQGSVNVQINTDGENVTANIALNLTQAPSSGGGSGSCPYVYSFNGESYIFNGDIYAGAIYSCLERHDYTPLIGLRPVNGEYKIKIANELQERQYTNLAELMVITHPKGTEILFDKYGEIQTLSNKQAPSIVVSSEGNDYSRATDNIDSESYLFNEINNPQNTWFETLSNFFNLQSGKNSLLVTFDKTKNAEKGKLVLRAKNTNWLIYLYHELSNFFGNSYSDWQKKQNLRPSQELLEERLDEGVPMMVFVEKENEWEYVDCFNLVGSVVSRDMVMPIDLSKIKGDKVKIKLECGFMFWDLDYVAMDYTENIPCKIEKISPSLVSSVKEKSKKLISDDNLYLEHLKCGDEDILSYKVRDPLPTKNYSIFLHSKGYYEQNIKNENEPEYLNLIGFILPGAFAKYSKNHFLEYSKTNAIAANSKFGL